MRAPGGSSAWGSAPQGWASIYVRSWGDSKCRFKYGPLPLVEAMEELDKLVASELTSQRQYVLYYELRGVGGCQVRYRKTIVRSAVTEVLPGIRPGRLLKDARFDGR